MNTQDRELLELAANAMCSTQHPSFCNYSVVSEEVGVCLELGSSPGAITRYWNPLTDDGDALRLAVDLRLVVHVWDDCEMTSAAKTLPDGDDPHPNSEAWVSADAHACGDLYAATRRAIVRAAAEIGKAMI